MHSIQPNSEPLGTGADDGAVGVTSTYSRTPLMTSPTTTQLSTPLPQNRFFVPTIPADQHVTVPNYTPAASFNVTSAQSTKFNSTSNMTSSYDSKNSSNTSFSVRFTTMKPCKWTLCRVIYDVNLDGALLGDSTSFHTATKAPWNLSFKKKLRQTPSISIVLP